MAKQSRCSISPEKVFNPVLSVCSVGDAVICGSGFQLRRNKGGPTSFVICPNTHLVSDEEKEQNMRGWRRDKGSKMGKIK